MGSGTTDRQGSCLCLYVETDLCYDGLTGWDPAGHQQNSWLVCHCPLSPLSGLHHLDGWRTPWWSPLSQPQRWSTSNKTRWWGRADWSTWHQGLLILTSNWEKGHRVRLMDGAWLCIYFVWRHFKFRSSVSALELFNPSKRHQTIWSTFRAWWQWPVSDLDGLLHQSKPNGLHENWHLICMLIKKYIICKLFSFSAALYFNIKPLFWLIGRFSFFFSFLLIFSFQS